MREVETKGLTDISEFKKNSHKIRLQELYKSLDNMDGIEDALNTRRTFYRQKRAEFISIFRLKSGWLISDVARFLNKTVDEIVAIENGSIAINDDEFFKLCHLINAMNEVNVFHEKIEEAFRSGLRDSRRKIEGTLKQYGLVFAYDHQKDQEERGCVLKFPTKR